MAIRDMRYRREFLGEFPSVEEEQVALDLIKESIPEILKQPKIIQSSTPVEPEVKSINRFKELLF